MLEGEIGKNGSISMLNVFNEFNASRGKQPTEPRLCPTSELFVWRQQQQQISLFSLCSLW
jgi:hypothetical protein